MSRRLVTYLRLLALALCLALGFGPGIGITSCSTDDGCTEYCSAKLPDGTCTRVIQVCDVCAYDPGCCDGFGDDCPIWPS